MTQNRIIVWFRQDLRLADNPALFEAAREAQVIPIYILDDHNAGEFRMGAASRWWLHHSLHALDSALDDHLQVYAGDAKQLLPELAGETGARAVYCNRCYEPWRIRCDAAIKRKLAESGVGYRSFNAGLLWEPWEVLKKDGTPYSVFTPFYKTGCLGALTPRKPLSAPPVLNLASRPDNSTPIPGLGLLPSPPATDWASKLAPHWHIGEQGAQQTLAAFLREKFGRYRGGRDFPARENVSRLSPHLHFGEISPNQTWHAARDHSRHNDENLESFSRELGWREFAHHLLYHFPELPRRNFHSRFDAFPWENDEEKLRLWQQGRTGYPLVDAGMRELWQTGYMHNRVRMVAGSFLVKNLLLHWRHGEQWFRDCLVDADLANNSAGWQWIAGSGADAAPYFRVFNPVLQGEKFDPEGEYTRRFVPELARLPARYLHAPWRAREDILQQAGIVLGKDYPRPLVDLKASREKALQAYADARSSGKSTDTHGRQEDHQQRQQRHSRRLRR